MPSMSVPPFPRGRLCQWLHCSCNCAGHAGNSGGVQATPWEPDTPRALPGALAAQSLVITIDLSPTKHACVQVTQLATRTNPYFLLLRTSAFMCAGDSACDTHQHTIHVCKKDATCDTQQHTIHVCRKDAACDTHTCLAPNASPSNAVPAKLSVKMPSPTLNPVHRQTESSCPQVCLHNACEQMLVMYLFLFFCRPLNTSSVNRRKPSISRMHMLWPPLGSASLSRHVEQTCCPEKSNTSLITSLKTPPSVTLASGDHVALCKTCEGTW